MKTAFRTFALSGWVALMAGLLSPDSVQGQMLDTSFVVGGVEAPVIPTGLLALVRSLPKLDSLEVEGGDRDTARVASGSDLEGDSTLADSVAAHDLTEDSITTDSLDSEALGRAGMELLLRAAGDPKFPANFVAEQLRNALNDPANEEVWSKLQESIALVYGSPDSLGTPFELVNAAEALQDRNEAVTELTPISLEAEPVVDEDADAGESDQDAVGRSGRPPMDGFSVEAAGFIWGETKDFLITRGRKASASLSVLSRVGRDRIGIQDGWMVWVPWLALGALALTMVLLKVTRAVARLLGRREVTAGAHRGAVKTARKMVRKGTPTSAVARKTGLPREAIQVLDLLRRREEPRLISPQPHLISPQPHLTSPEPHLTSPKAKQEVA